MATKDGPQPIKFDIRHPLIMCYTASYAMHPLHTTHTMLHTCPTCYCNGFEITSVLEKHIVEDDILFTNHLAGKEEILAKVVEYYPSSYRGHGSNWL